MDHDGRAVARRREREGRDERRGGPVVRLPPRKQSARSIRSCKAFWSFQPIRKPAVPQPRDAGWAKNDIDRFVLARLEREGMAPVGTADKRTLIRRATLDLTGLPATIEEIEAFQKDDGR